jgi:hypothetical protein
MKKLLLILLCLPMIGFGQYLNSTSIWLVSDADLFTWQFNDYQYYINGSTNLNSNDYYNIYWQGINSNSPIGQPSVITPFSGGPIHLREDGSKWYVYDYTTLSDKLLCDFNLVVGDDISSFTAAYFLTPAPIITNITNVTLFGSTIRKMFHLDNGFYFTEGVGNLAGLFSNYAQAIEYGSSLNCYIQDNINWSGASDSNCIPIFGCTFTQTDESSTGACDGSITITNLGGCIPPYIYIWNNGQSTPTATGLCAGTYSFDIIDSNGDTCCSNTVNILSPLAIQEHTTNKELLKTTDLLGRETKETNQPLLYLYDDGTVEKRIVIE